MAAENDILTGLDISSLTSVEQSQIMQMINQAAPLVNKGLIIAQATTPDIAGNARYSRYIWLDTTTTPPTPKIYNSVALIWDSLVVGAGSIVNAMVSAAAAIAITKLAFGTARYIVRTNAAGNALEFCNPNALFTNNDIPLVAIDSSAAPAAVKSYLQRNATTGISSWQQIAFADFAAGDLLSVARIASGVNGQVLGTVTGAAAWADIITLIADNTIGVAKLTGAAAAFQVIRRNAVNNANEWATPIFTKEMVPYVSANVFTVDFPAGASARVIIPHGLLVVPKIVRAVAVNVNVELGYAVGDEVDVASFSSITTAGQAFFAVVSDGVNITVISDNSAGASVVVNNKTPATASAIGRGNWRIKVYAWA